MQAMTERQWQRFVMDLASLNGWMVAHFRPALTAAGNWVTPVSGDGKGFPDLVLVRERVVYAELKTDTGRLSLEQELWLDALSAAGADARVWRPRDEEEVWQCLTQSRPGGIVRSAGRRGVSTNRRSPHGQ